MIREFKEPDRQAKVRATMIVAACVVMIMGALLMFDVDSSRHDASARFGDQRIDGQRDVVDPRSGWSIEESGGDINAVDDGGTALCKAAKYAGHDEVRTLLDRGADPNVYYGDGSRTHPIACALAGSKPWSEVRRILHALAEGGAVIPRNGIIVVGTSHVDAEDLLSFLGALFEVEPIGRAVRVLTHT